MNNPMNSESGNISGINVTPLVDVSLVLVLVFMVSSPFFTKTLSPVQLPKAVSSSSEDQKNIAVSISPEHGYSVNETAVSKKELSKELARQKEETGFDFLLVRADEKVSHGDVEDVMRAGKELGFKRIAFATEPKGW